MTTRTVIVRSGLIYKKRTQTPSSGGYVPRYSRMVAEAGGKKTAFRHVRKRYGEERPCLWEENWREAICDNHQWYIATWDNSERGLCLDPLPDGYSFISEAPDENEYVNRILKCDPSHIPTSLNWPRTIHIMWEDELSGEKKIRCDKYLIIKIATYYTDPTPYWSPTAIFVNVIGKESSTQFTFERHPTATPGPWEYYIDDNEGDEQTIDLRSFGLDGPIRAINVSVYLRFPTERGGFELDYIKLSERKGKNVIVNPNA